MLREFRMGSPPDSCNRDATIAANSHPQSLPNNYRCPTEAVNPAAVRVTSEASADSGAQAQSRALSGNTGRGR
jgi:hypothetical protein